MNNIPNIKHTESGNFFLIAGPCVVESEENVGSEFSFTLEKA